MTELVDTTEVVFNFGICKSKGKMYTYKSNVGLLTITISTPDVWTEERSLELAIDALEERLEEVTE